MKVLLLHKKSAHSRKNPSATHRPGRTFIGRDLKRQCLAQIAHRKALAHVLSVLRKHRLSFSVATHNRKRLRAGFDLVVTVGGDGTFLEGARWVKSEPILGVNSDPKRSVGSFCAADAGSFESRLKAFLSGKARIVELPRMEVSLNRQSTPIRVLNDILITHRRPAAMSRYWLQIGEKKEEQRSSGLWVSTAAGSTGAIRSAGGRAVLRTRPVLQYQPRELYCYKGSSYRLIGGFIPKGAKIQVGSLMEQGLACLDGEHVTLPLRYGDWLNLSLARHPLRLIA